MKLFVWDFHGTLEKDNENAVFEISNAVLKNLGYKERFTKEENSKLYGKKWSDYFAYLLPHESGETHFFLQQKCIEYEGEHPEIIKSYIMPNDHAKYVLSKIAKKHKQILVSNMSDVGLSRFMEAVNMFEFFPKDSAFATNSYKKQVKTTKKEILKNYLKGKSFEQVITIGDTEVDVEMGKAVGATTYLYVHPGREFSEIDADYKINNLREVLKEV